MPTLAKNVILNNPSTGLDVLFLAGDAAVPDWAQRRILNPDAWVGGVAPHAAGIVLPDKGTQVGVLDDRPVAAGNAGLRWVDSDTGGETISDGVDWRSSGVAPVEASGVGFTPAGAVAATNVQAAIAELDAEKTPIAAVVHAFGAMGAAVTLLAATDAQASKGTLSANCTVTLPAATAGWTLTLQTTQAASGGPYTVTVAGGTVKWPAGAAGTASTAASAVDLWTFKCVDGATWLASVVKGYA